MNPELSNIYFTWIEEQSDLNISIKEIEGCDQEGNFECRFTEYIIAVGNDVFCSIVSLGDAFDRAMEKYPLKADIENKAGNSCSKCISFELDGDHEYGYGVCHVRYKVVHQKDYCAKFCSVL